MYYLLIQIVASDSTLRLIAIPLLRMAKNGHTHQATLANDHLGLIHTSDENDRSGVVSGVGIGRKL